MQSRTALCGRAFRKIDGPWQHGRWHPAQVAHAHLPQSNQSDSVSAICFCRGTSDNPGFRAATKRRWHANASDRRRCPWRQHGEGGSQRPRVGPSSGRSRVWQSTGPASESSRGSDRGVLGNSRQTGDCVAAGHQAAALGNRGPRLMDRKASGPFAGLERHARTAKRTSVAHAYNNSPNRGM